MKKFKFQLDTKNANEKRKQDARNEVAKSMAQKVKPCPNCDDGKINGKTCIACGGFGERRQ